MNEREACSRLIEQWEARARKAFPTDAMLINRHIRELHEALAQPVAAEPEQVPSEPSQERLQNQPLSPTIVGALADAAGYFEPGERADFINGLRWGERAHGIDAAHPTPA